jgi:glycosyltransferase involved in cell wall biosynthesis
MLSIIIPIRQGGNADITLESLKKQTFQDFIVTLSHDTTPGGNACITRNQGYKKAPAAPFVLFSDDDIQWEPYALELLLDTLKKYPGRAYSYGAYERDCKIFCNQEWDENLLQHNNYIDTSSIVRRECLPNPPFDPQLPILQDWDLWLRMLKAGHKGIYCGRQIFTTTYNKGITFHNKHKWADTRKFILGRFHSK